MGILSPVDQSEHIAPSQVYGWRPYALAFSASFASAMFGYDSAFIGGTLALPAFRTTFGLNAATATALASQIVSTFQAGCFFGALFVYPIITRLGRKPGLLIAGLLFAIGAAIQTGANGSVGMIYGGRVLTGLGVGSSSLIVPLYISECSPPALRGRLIGIFEIQLQFWLVIGFWVNYGVSTTLAASDTQWRITFGLQLAPAALLVGTMLLQPESPRYLVEKGKIDQARQVLARIRNLPIEHEYIAYEVNAIQQQLAGDLVITHGETSIASKLRVMRQPSILKRLGMGVALMWFQNFSGINALNYYSPTIVRSIGFTGTNVGLLATGIYGIVKAVATLVFMVVGIDRLGRRNALLIGSVGAAFSLYSIAVYSAVSNSFVTAPPLDGGAYYALVAIYLFAVFYAFSWNGIPWIFCAEVFPSGVRVACLVITTMNQWLAQFVIAFSFPYMVRSITYGVFILFGTAVVLGCAFVFLIVPETKGISLEEMDILFSVPGRASAKRAKTLEIIGEARSSNRLVNQEKATAGYYEKSDDV